MENLFYHQFYGFLKTPALRLEINDEFQQFRINKVPEIEKLPPAPEIPPRLILGKRIEYLFEFYLTHFSDEEILLKNVQIKSGKITIGEIDFLLKNKNSKMITHVELVYKFYLYDPTVKNETERWIGPNRNDSLSRKLKKLREGQLPLLFKEETGIVLQELGISAEEIVQKVCFKANLFLPFNFEKNSLTETKHQNIQGYWIKFRDFEKAGFKNDRFFIPKKINWPIKPKNGEIWYTYSEILPQVENFIAKRIAPLVWIKTKNTHKRFFVVWW